MAFCLKKKIITGSIQTTIKRILKEFHFKRLFHSHKKHLFANVNHMGFFFSISHLHLSIFNDFLHRTAGIYPYKDCFIFFQFWFQ